MKISFTSLQYEIKVTSLLNRFEFWLRAVLFALAFGSVPVNVHAAFPATMSEGFEIVCPSGLGCQFGSAIGGVVTGTWRDTFAEACQDKVGTAYNGYTVVSASIGAGGKCWGSAPPGYPNFDYTWNSFKSRWFNCWASNSHWVGSGQCDCDAPKFKESLNTAGTCSAVVTVNDAEKPMVNCPWCGNPVNMFTGTKRETVKTDLKVGGLELTLTYDTTSKLPADKSNPEVSLTNLKAFGALWRSNFHHKLEVAANAKSALLSRGDGSVLNFSGNGAGIFTSAGDNPHKLVSITGGYRFSDVFSGVLETFDSAGNLVGFADADGNALAFVYSADELVSVQSTEGRTIRFVYNTGRITQIVGADSGVVVAAYDAASNLTSLTWPDGKASGFVYENSTFPWALTGKVDENNTRYATFTYDGMGRAISTEHAGGVENYSVSFAEPAMRSVVESFDTTANVWSRAYGWKLPVGTTMTTPNGQSVAFDAQLVAGVPAVTGSSQPAGSGAAASVSGRSYDGNGNVVSSDDFQGSRTCYAYDSSNREIAIVEGLATTVACSGVLAPNVTLPNGARKTATSWHPDWRLPAQRVEPLLTTTTVYHGRSDPFNSNATANCTTAAARADGKPLPVVCRKVQQATVNSAGADPADPLLGSVQLLLHGEGTNGGTSIVDSSPNNFTPTTQGGVTITTADKKFGSGGLSASSGATLKYSGNAGFLFTGDVTVEGYFKIPVSNQNIQFFNMSTTEAPGRIVVYTSATGTLRYNRYGSSEITVNSSTTLVPVGTWFHLAVVRSGSTITYYVNGTNAGTTSDAGTLGNGTGGFGIATSIPNGILFDEVRVSKDVTRYTANFTPAAQEFIGSSPAVSTSTTRYTYDSLGHVLSSVDPNGKTATFAYYTDSVFSGSYDLEIGKVALLLRGNGTNGSTSITDDSLGHKTVSVVGNAKISTAQSKLGGAAMAFDGAGDYVTIPYSADFAFGTGDFTIETFLYKNGNNANSSRIWNPNGDFYDGVNMGLDGSGNFAVYASTSGNSWTHYLPVVAALSNGQWYHLAVVRNGGSLYAFVDGTRYTVTTALGTSALYTDTAHTRVIGGQAGVDRALNGYIDEFRITKGVARYTANFTPPTQEFPSTGPTASATGHTVGDLQGVTNAAGHVTQFNLYDPAGRVRQMTDPKGVVTDITYTPRGWVSTVTATPPGGTARTTTYGYDFVGQVTGVASPDGTSVSYSYDAAHRLTGATDAKGNSVTYTLDNVGNRIAEQIKDPTGTLQRSIGRSFDALNRLQQVTGAAR